MTISTSDLTSNVATTSGVVTGDGVFDDLMETVNAQLDNQFKLGRITGKEYATVYLGALQTVLQQSVQFALGKEKTNAEVDLLVQKKITEFAQTQQSTVTAPNTDSVLGKQATLYGEQAKGFKWNADQKFLDTVLKAWAVNVNTAGTPSSGVDVLGTTGTDNINTTISNAKPT